MRLATSVFCIAVSVTLARGARAEEPVAPTSVSPSDLPVVEAENAEPQPARRRPESASSATERPSRPTSVEQYDVTLQRMRDALTTAPPTRAVRLRADLETVEQWYREDVQTGSTAATVGIVAGSLMVVGGGAVAVALAYDSLGGGFNYCFGGCKSSAGNDKLFIGSLVVAALGIPVVVIGIVGATRRSIRVADSPPSTARGASLSLGAGQVQFQGTF